MRRALVLLEIVWLLFLSLLFAWWLVAYYAAPAEASAPSNPNFEPTPTVTPTLFVNPHGPTPTPTPTPVVTADEDWTEPLYPRWYLPWAGANLLPSVCGCTYDAYDCADFPNQIAAQLCFNECASRIDTGKQHSDLHHLDPNQDGFACSKGDTP